jgi:hypothetical protein
MIYLGLDWAEDHHDVALMNEAGTVLDERRIGDTVEDVVLIHELVRETDATRGTGGAAGRGER